MVSNTDNVQQTYSRMISLIPPILLFFGLLGKTSAGMGNPHRAAQRLEFAAGDGNQEFAPRNEVTDLRNLTDWHPKVETMRQGEPVSHDGNSKGFLVFAFVFISSNKRSYD